MKKIWSIARTDLRITFSERSIWINLVVVPVALILVIGIANSGITNAAIDANDVRQNIDIIDYDNSALSALFTETLTTVSPTLRACPMQNTDADACGLNGEPLNEELAAARLENGSTPATVIIPEGFGEAVIQGDTTTLIYRSGENATQDSVIRQAVNAAAQRMSAAEVARQFAQNLDAEVETGIAGYSEQVYERALELWAEDLINVTYVESQEVNDSEVAVAIGFQQSVPGMGSMYVLFTVLAGSVILIQERKQWTLQRITTMPVTRGQFIAGKMLSRFIMGMIQFGVAFATGYVLTLFTDTTMGSSFFGLVLVMAAFTAVASALALLIATITRTEDQAGSLVTLLALTLAPLGGAWWPLTLEFIPDFMVQLSYISPIRWAMDGFNQVIVYGGTWVDTLPQVGALLAMAAVLFVLASSRLRAVDA